MTDDADRVAIRAKVRALADDAGLQRTGLAASLGEGLCRLWGINPQASDSIARKKVIPKFIEIVQACPDETPQKYVRAAGLLSFNISKLTHGYSFGYTNRQRCLEKKFRKENELPDVSGKPLCLSRSLTKVREHADDVYDYLAEVLYRQWRQFAQGEPFPTDLATPKHGQGLHGAVKTGESDMEDSRPRRRKLIASVSAAVIAILGATALLWHPWSSSPTQSGSKAPSGPLALAITSLRSSLDGYSLAFPAAATSKAATFESTYENATGDLQPTFQQALQAGAYSFGSEVLNLQANTNSDDQLAITGIHAVNIKRGPVATGTVINNPGGAGGGPNIGFDLDQPTPDARTDNNGTLGDPYFQAQLLSVSRLSATALELEFIGHGASYSFNIEIDYLDGQAKRSLILPNAADGGQPFVGRVSGTLCDHPPNLSSTALAQFNALQYGHVVEPVGNADGSRTMQSVSSADFKAGACG